MWIKFLKAGFLGLIIGYILAMLLNRWVWLEMRINIGAIIPGSIVFLFILAFWKKFNVSVRLLLCLEALFFAGFLLIIRIRFRCLGFPSGVPIQRRMQCNLS